MINKIKEFCIKNFILLFVVVFTYIAYLSIFKSTSAFYNMNSVILIILSCLTLISFCYLFILIQKYNKKTLLLIMLFSFILMLVIEFIVAYNMMVSPSWDFWRIFNGGIQLAKGNYNIDPYFWASYPNNIGVTIFLGILFKPLSYFINNESYFLYYDILINIIMIFLAQASLVWVIYRKKGLGVATFTSVFILFITPFYCYSPIVYTDTLSMVFPILSLGLLDVYETSSSRKKYLWLILMAFIITIGFIIKTNVIITLIAIIIYFLIKYNFLDAIKKIIVISVVLIVMMTGYKGVAQKLMPTPYDEAGLPATHWIMMGMAGKGGYNVEDVSFSQQIYDDYGKQAVKEANLKVIKERLNNYGVKGYLKFINNKLIFTWTDGTYFVPEKLRRTPVKDTKMYSYIVGENNKYYVYISQVMHIILLVGIILSAIKNFKSKIDIYSLSCIALFGTVLFLMIWETRSRYIVLMLPIMILCCIDGLEFLDFNIKNIVKNKKK